MTGQVLVRDKAPDLQTEDVIMYYQVRATTHIRGSVTQICSNGEMKIRRGTLNKLKIKDLLQ